MKDKIVLLCRGEMLEFCCLNSLKEWIDDNDHEVSIDICDDCKKETQ